jgi:endonuclease
LREHIETLEAGLTIIDGQKEKSVASGRIDIMAKGRDGATVVLELKAGEADRDAIGQILAYMGDLMADEKSVRGILVAANFTHRAIAAARAAGNIRLAQYGFTFSFRTVTSGA